jgi:hypothetical protein
MIQKWGKGQTGRLSISDNEYLYLEQWRQAQSQRAIAQDYHHEINDAYLPPV